MKGVVDRFVVVTCVVCFCGGPGLLDLGLGLGLGCGGLEGQCLWVLLPNTVHCDGAVEVWRGIWVGLRVG
jgi:hypothetical protein